MEREELRSSAEAIYEGMRAGKIAVARKGMGDYEVVWGIAWMVGGLGTELILRSGMDVNLIGTLWSVVSLLGILATALVTVRVSKRSSFPEGFQIFLFWVAFLLYGIFWVILLKPSSGVALSVFLISLAMFGYIVTGILLLSWELMGLGLLVTVVCYAGFVIFPGFYGFVIAFAGLIFLIGGLLYNRRWGR